MKKVLLALVAILISSLAIFYFLPSSSKPADANVVFQDASGKKLTEKDFNGKPTVYYAWASWCPDCQQELPILNTLKEKYADKVEFVGVAMISQKEPIENGKKYLKENSLSLNYYSDVDSSFQKYHEITEIPTLIFTDKNGKIVKKSAGILPQEEIEAYIKEIL
ncbi:MAG: TlpA disulfide reductase family protein [Carnobacterium sp.]|nr:TlpA disulfide reductase family protein [Carnobacterium sp.]